MRRAVGLVQVVGELPQHRGVAVDRADRRRLAGWSAAAGGDRRGRYRPIRRPGRDAACRTWRVGSSSARGAGAVQLWQAPQLACLATKLPLFRGREIRRRWVSRLLPGPTCGARVPFSLFKDRRTCARSFSPPPLPAPPCRSPLARRRPKTPPAKPPIRRDGRRAANADAAATAVTDAADRRRRRRPAKPRPTPRRRDRDADDHDDHRRLPSKLALRLRTREGRGLTAAPFLFACEATRVSGAGVGAVVAGAGPTCARLRLVTVVDRPGDAWRSSRSGTGGCRPGR